MDFLTGIQLFNFYTVNNVLLPLIGNCRFIKIIFLVAYVAVCCTLFKKSIFTSGEVILQLKLIFNKSIRFHGLIQVGFV